MVTGCSGDGSGETVDPASVPGAHRATTAEAPAAPASVRRQHAVSALSVEVGGLTPTLVHIPSAASGRWKTWWLTDVGEVGPGMVLGRR